ncbi:hypothetical protein GS429_00430 [Natronorubrum sp. JWXQ-INN-674]|uniref:Uncharacterized protein n=1 Tax=Natronorubrum halalkaliphilum TaxID=2691917 RepID=A0A6B0VGC4_9EURY|nr:hypothetical protein [Natronorubrum halalkaliphilum]MXV60558.1 hypothetical protein [Natronorubrum halalkaliphilum]
MANQTPWEATLEDMRSIAADLEEDGWETLSIAAGDTAPVSPDAGPDDRFGLVHVVQGDDADRLEEILETASITESESYLAVVSGTEYTVTVVSDPESRVAVLLTGAFEYQQARPCFDAAARRGVIYSHVQRLDGTRVAVFEHDDPELFEPSET